MSGVIRRIIRTVDPNKIVFHTSQGKKLSLTPYLDKLPKGIQNKHWYSNNSLIDFHLKSRMYSIMPTDIVKNSQPLYPIPSIELPLNNPYLSIVYEKWLYISDDLTVWCSYYEYNEPLLTGHIIHQYDFTVQSDIEMDSLRPGSVRHISFSHKDM